MRKLAILSATASLALAYCGCDAAAEKSLHEELVRTMYTEEFGPVVLASIVGSATPSGGPSALHAICSDRAWGVLYSSAGSGPSAGFVPSMFEGTAPGPDREARVRLIRQLAGPRSRGEDRPNGPELDAGR